MRIGVPREIKVLEGRVSLVPAAVAELLADGHEVFIEQGAGALSGYDDALYQAAGAQVLADAAAVYAQAELIVKVKEPIEADLALLRDDHVLFSFLHLAANSELTQRLQAIGLLALAFETVAEKDGRLPLLAPMSEIAGRLAGQVGTTLLHQPNGGKGLLLGGLPAAERGRVVVLGAGMAGGAAVQVVAAQGAEVVVFDKNRDRLAQMRALGNNVTALYPYQHQIEREVRQADLLIGAVLVVGEKAPHLVSADDVRDMADGSVVIDISVDQGGCIETTRPTDYAEPTFVWQGVVHFGVTNMPGAVPRSASQALSAALMPYLRSLAKPQWRQHPALVSGINVEKGQICHASLLKSVP